MAFTKAKCFTRQARRILNVLTTEVAVGPAFDPTIGEGPPALNKYVAIWDTGATGSVITQRVVDAGGLIPIGMALCHGVQGEHTTEVYLVSIALPNGVG